MKLMPLIYIWMKHIKLPLFSSGNPIPVVGSSGALAASLNDFHARATSRASSNLRSVEAAAAALAAVDAVEQQQPQQPAQPEVNQADVATLMDMGFPRERCIEALTANSRYINISYGTVVRDFESEAKTRCNFQFR